MSTLRFSVLARILVAAAGLSVASLHLVGCRPEVPASAPSATAALPAVLSAHRWIEPRLTGGTVHEPCDLRCPPEGSLCEPICPGRPDEVYHNLPASVSQWVKDDQGSAAERHAAAVLALVAIREPETTEKAVKMLETLAAQNPQDAGVLSDLSAAYVVLAQRIGDAAYLPRAMKAADEAIGADPSSTEARFNRALASACLALWPDARTAWSVYLEQETDSGWVGEAQQRQQEIPRVGDASNDWTRLRDLLAADEGRNAETIHDLVERHPAATRRWVGEEILPAWARATLEGRKPDTERSRAMARRVSEELAAQTGDVLLLDAVDAIETADAEGLQLLAEGHLAYGEAERSYRSFELQAATESYRRAGQALARAASPFRPWADVGLAVCLYQDHELPAALELLLPLREEAERLGSGSLAGRVSWIIGLCQVYANLPTEALGSYRSAIDRFRAGGELENVASVEARMAEDSLWGLGDVDLAWRHRLQALSAARHVVEPRSQIFVLSEAAMALGSELPQAAYALRKEALYLAQHSVGSPVYLAITLRFFAESRLGTGQRDEILADLTTAFSLSGQVPHTGVRQAIQARLRELEGRLLREEAPARAIDAYREALELLPQDEYRGYRANLYLERASALLAAGDRAGALSDLVASVAEIEAEWRQVLDHRRPGEHEALWSNYFGLRQETFETMVRLQAEMGREGEALTYSEKARSRDLLDLVADLPSSHPAAGDLLSSLTAKDLGRRLPPGKVVVEYALLGDRLLTWILRRDAKPTLLIERLDRGEVEQAVGKIHRAAESRDPDLDPEALSWLHGLLVGPVLAAVKPGEELVFVPDGALHGVPFAALRASSTSRFLIQDHPIAVAPSATLYVYTQQRDQEMLRPDPPRVLLIGDPEFDPNVHLGLERLKGAELETREVAALYRETTLLTGDLATKDAFLGLWDRYDVVHFAGHAIANPSAPFKSMLLLAPSDSGPASGALYATELFRDLPPRTRLVVLSACSSAGGHPIGPLGVASFVRPILGAGVPAVVGSLWDVSDLATRKLLTEFHRRLSAGADAATALQQAQNALLNGDNGALGTPFIWAPFQVVGGASLTDHVLSVRTIKKE